MLFTYIAATLYIVILVAVCIKIIADTTTPSKGLAYLLLVITFPIFGIIIYMNIGLNYRKKKLYQKKINIDEKLFPELERKRAQQHGVILENKKTEIGDFAPMLNLLEHKGLISDNNKVNLLLNGENKFPEVLKCLREAKHHIHIEYYIFDNDEIGNQLADILVQKAKEGVKVRFIYDDFGSRNIRKNIVKRLQKNGVHTAPFYKINFVHLANRLNYRDHRKIIVIDGAVGFIGGINVADNYINQAKNDLFWRDTHLKIVGESVMNLQYTFLSSWNFCAEENIGFSEELFPINIAKKYGDQLVQIRASGPDSDYPKILYSFIQIMLLAKKELLITTPYFIPHSSFLNAIKIAALSGLKVKLLVPEKGDSLVVNTTSQAFFEDVLEAGVEIYRYSKGFVHAKTMVCDEFISVVGTANLDNRSFELNFEINALVYDKKIALELKSAFQNDLKDSKQLTLEEWKNRPLYLKFFQKLVFLFSSLM